MAYDTTRGININGVGKMQDAISAYQKKVDSACGAALGFAGYRNQVMAAIAGTKTLATLTKYMDDLKSKQSALVSTLHKFYTELTNIKAAYNAQDAKFTFK